MTPTEAGRQLAATVTISDEQAREFARILLVDESRIAA